MAHINEYLSPCPAYGWQGGPTFSTQIVELSSGAERRNANWAQARHRYTASFQNIDLEAYREVKRMHLVCRGRLNCFRFRDELDHQADNEVFAFGNGIQETFQLTVISVVDTVSYARKVTAVAQMAQLTANGSPLTEGVDFEVDYERGLVTMDNPPADGVVLRWTGVFDVWVRFDTDDLPFTLDGPDYTNGQVAVIEVPPPPVED